MHGICLLMVAAALSVEKAPPAPLKWHPNYTEALKVTKASAKPLLVVVDDPAKPQSRSRLVQDKPDKARTELLRNYELCHVDARTEHGKRVAQAFDVSQFPFTAVIDKSGAGILYQKSGQLTNEECKVQLETYREGQLPGAAVVSSARNVSTASNCFT
jgi:hypothetical protein